MNKGNSQTIAQEVKATQKQLDKLVPGKVKVSAEWDSERRCTILIGEYDMYISHTPEGEDTKIVPMKSAWTESMDKFYTDNKLFVGFFKQRAKFMNATPEVQAAFNDHPSQF
tara:strand:+ start:1439 stop:1774 length:336 start_codon:yes stop_codon:yes gene_type:complete